MKIRELKQKAGAAVMSAWPPGWGGSYGRDDKFPTFPTGDQGVLVAVERQGDDHLSLTIEYEGKRHSGSLQWDTPPSLDDVEKVLNAHRGKTIKVISELDI